MATLGVFGGCWWRLPDGNQTVQRNRSKNSSRRGIGRKESAATISSLGSLLGPGTASVLEVQFLRARWRVDLTQEPWLHRDIQDLLRSVEYVGQFRQCHSQAEAFEPVYGCRHALHDIDKLICPVDPNVLRFRCEAYPSFRRHSVRHPTSILEFECNDTLAEAPLDPIADHCLEIACLHGLGRDDVRV